MLGKGLGGFGDMAGLVKHAMDLRSNMESLKEQLGSETVEAAAGGGIVKVVMNGKMELLSLTINPEIMDPEDPEMLETLVAAAVNEGIRKAQDLLKTKMSQLTGGIDIPGITS